MRVRLIPFGQIRWRITTLNIGNTRLLNSLILPLIWQFDHIIQYMQLKINYAHELI